MHPTSAAAQYAQAFAAFRQGNHAAAMRLLDALVGAYPQHADAWNLAGVISNMRRDFASAAHCFDRAAALGAGPGALTNLGFAQLKLGRPADAERAYAGALQLDPRLAIAWQKLGELQQADGRGEAALASYSRAMALDADDLKSHGNAVFLRRDMADWDESSGPTPRTLLRALLAARRTDFGPMLLLALPEADAALQRRVGQLFAQSQWAAALAAPPLSAAAKPLDGRRLRVGYLSSDLRDHPVAYLLSDVLLAHDRAAVEVFLYSHGAAAADDAWRNALAANVEHFVDITRLDDRAAALLIAHDGIDVLVDLNGYTQDTRLGVVAFRPAPVVASWLGYIGTLGEPRLADYVIADRVAAPPSSLADFSEAPAWMPQCFQPNAPLAPLPAPPTRAAEGLPEDAVVFCSFNQTFKLNPALWDDWCTVLRAVPGSVLWLAPPRQAMAMDNLRGEASRRGVAPERIVFAARRPRNEHVARIALADLALDTYPYNSGTTGSDALRAGVPLLAFPGDTFVGRMAASLLHSAGIPECIAADRGSLVELATRLGRDALQRARLRARLLANRDGAGLFRPETFARDLERLFAAMHAQAVSGLRDPIELEPVS